MPLLMCPNDNVSMTQVNRQGVEFDMCPECRGVWLDRGELEKLMSTASAEAGSAMPPVGGQGFAQPSYAPQAPQPPRAQPWGYGEQGEYGERGEHGERGGYSGGRRRKSLGIFDIFD